uniref:Choline-specific glycerophosphodiester phosphodiesterase n=1 Tax=Strongyloides venezuelensis TaxID=75913 RepID=A0A0K0EX79_STRVS
MYFIIKIFLFLLLTIITDKTSAILKQDALGQNLIVLLIDGYGNNLFNKTNSKLSLGIQTLLENGVQADYLKPIFPTWSYPTWTSLSTGLYPENHHMSSDFMYDEENEMLFQRDEGENDTDYRWFIDEPDPIWYTAGKANVNVHCYWFSTCHRAHGDQIVRVDKKRRHSFKNKNDTNLLAEIPSLIRHIKKFQPYRQQLALMRFNGVANALQNYGENSHEFNQALSAADVTIRKIQEELEAKNLFETTNFIVLSGHGYMPFDEEEQFYLDECLEDFSRVKRVVNSLSMMLVYPQEGEEDTVFFELKVCDQWAPMGDYEGDEQPLVRVYRHNEVPDRYHWKNGRHMAPIVIMTKPGTILLTRQIPSTDISEALGREVKEISGWDNEASDMLGIFMARGPAFKSNYKTGPVDLVDVYPLMLGVLGLQAPHQNNGSWSNVIDMISDDWESKTARDPNYNSSPSLFVSSLILLPLFSVLQCFVREH